MRLMHQWDASGAKYLFKVFLQFSCNTLIYCLHPLRVQNHFIFYDLIGINCFFLNTKYSVCDKATDKHIFSDKFQLLIKGLFRGIFVYFVFINTEAQLEHFHHKRRSVSSIARLTVFQLFINVGINLFQQ